MKFDSRVFYPSTTDVCNHRLNHVTICVHHCVLWPSLDNFKIISRDKYENTKINCRSIGSLQREHGTLSTLKLIESYIEKNKNEKEDKKQV